MSARFSVIWFTVGAHFPCPSSFPHKNIEQLNNTLYERPLQILLPTPCLSPAKYLHQKVCHKNNSCWQIYVNVSEFASNTDKTKTLSRNNGRIVCFVEREVDNNFCQRSVTKLWKTICICVPSQNIVDC